MHPWEIVVHGAILEELRWPSRQALDRLDVGILIRRAQSPPFSTRGGLNARDAH